MIAMSVVFLGKPQDLRGAELNAKAATFAPVPVDVNYSPELPTSGYRRGFRHWHLKGGDFSQFLGLIVRFPPPASSLCIFISATGGIAQNLPAA
jgi:hypothetical protein